MSSPCERVRVASTACKHARTRSPEQKNQAPRLAPIALCSGLVRGAVREKSRGDRKQRDGFPRTRAGCRVPHGGRGRRRSALGKPAQVDGRAPWLREREKKCRRLIGTDQCREGRTGWKPRSVRWGSEEREKEREGGAGERGGEEREREHGFQFGDDGWADPRKLDSEVGLMREIKQGTGLRVVAGGLVNTITPPLAHIIRSTEHKLSTEAATASVRYRGQHVRGIGGRRYGAQRDSRDRIRQSYRSALGQSSETMDAASYPGVFGQSFALG